MEEAIVPTPEELADELTEHDRHPKIHHHPIFKSIIVICIYLLAICGLSFGVYLSIEGGKKFWAYHCSLKEQVAKTQELQKRSEDVARTLSMVYDHLTPWEAKYYTVIFLDFSDKYNIPWEAYAALVRYESNFNPTLKSDSGAVGMVQILESTGKKVALDLGIRWKNDETLWNDLFNMVIGLTYFSESFTDAVEEGQTRSEALQHAMRHYVSGIGDPSKIKKLKKEAQVYVKEYKTSVWKECKKLMMFYKGVQAGESDSLIIESMDL